ncbi:MAG: ATP synthase F1 subunit epsilon [Acidobacteriota bacterium]
MAKIKLEIITPERVLLQQDVDEVQIPTQRGEIGILPGHTPLISQLALSGLVKYRADGTLGRAVVGKGFVEISSDKVTILSSLAELPQEIDIASARRELESAERNLKNAEKDLSINVEEALVLVERASMRVRVMEREG